MGETRTVPLFNPNDGVTGRDGGPYLDNVEQHLAEERRAVVEKREPDHEKLLATAGVPLVTASQLVNQGLTTSLPSQAHNDVVGVLLTMHAEDELGAPQIDSIEVPVDTESSSESQAAQRDEDVDATPEFNLATDADA